MPNACFQSGITPAPVSQKCDGCMPLPIPIISALSTTTTTNLQSFRSVSSKCPRHKTRQSFKVPFYPINKKKEVPKTYNVQYHTNPLLKDGILVRVRTQTTRYHTNPLLKDGTLIRLRLHDPNVDAAPKQLLKAVLKAVPKVDAPKVDAPKVAAPKVDVVLPKRVLKEVPKKVSKGIPSAPVKRVFPGKNVSVVYISHNYVRTVIKPK